MRSPWWIVRSFADDPIETLLGARERFVERRELRASREKGGGFMPWPPCPYAFDEEWERALHQIVGAPWPCPEVEAFWALWSAVLDALQATEMRLGRGAFAGWGDGEPGFVRALWCVTRHLRPLNVVETGVARGITSRFVLEALERNGRGNLWSVDLPPPRDRSVHHQIGVAVPDRLRDRWSYVRGSSRRRLPGLLAQLERIDLFIHDSRHTERNLLFELREAWARLSPGGVLMADDVDLNCGFHAFRDAHRGAASVIGQAEPLEPDVGRQDDKGVFGFIRRDA